MEGEKCRYREIGEQRKKRKERRRGAAVRERTSVSAREVRQWFSKGPIDRYVRSSSVRLLSPSNQSLHHRVSHLRTLSRFTLRRTSRSSLFVKAASRIGRLRDALRLRIAVWTVAYPTDSG